MADIRVTIPPFRSTWSLQVGRLFAGCEWSGDANPFQAVFRSWNWPEGDINETIHCWKHLKELHKASIPLMGDYPWKSICLNRSYYCLRRISLIYWPVMIGWRLYMFIAMDQVSNESSTKQFTVNWSAFPWLKSTNSKLLKTTHLLPDIQWDLHHPYRSFAALLLLFESLNKVFSEYDNIKNLHLSLDCMSNYMKASLP